MAFVRGLEVEMVDCNMSAAEVRKLTDAIHSRSEKFLERTPSDSTMRVKVFEIGTSYKVVIHLASQALRFDASGAGRSPYVALELAMNLAREQVKSWSLGSRVSHI